MSRFIGQSVDRPPNYCIVMGFAAKEVNATYKEFATDYRVLVRGGMHCCEKYGIDVLSVISDPMREAEGFGAQCIIEGDQVPHSASPLLKSISDIGRLRIPASGKRMDDRLEAVRLYKENAGNEYPILGWVEGPIAESCMLRGMEAMFGDLIDEPEAAENLMDICTEQAINFALAQINCGADIIGVGDAAASLIGPTLYNEFVLPCQKRLFSAIHKAGAKVKLHICGNITSILPYIAETGADMVDIDHMVDFGTSITLLGEKNISVCGNFDPVEVLLRGNVSTVQNAVSDCLNVASETTAIAAGCEVPRNTPKENMLAVYDSLSAATKRRKI